MSNECNNSADALEQMRRNLEELRQIRQEIRDHNNEVTQRLQQLQSQQQQTSNIAPNIRSGKASSYTQQRSIQSSHDPTRQNRNSNTSSTIAAAAAAAPSSSSSSSHQPIAFTIDQTHRIRDSFSCTICVDYFESPYTLQCGHTFCKDCITTWFERQKTCPQCRRDIATRPIPAYTVELQVSTIRSLLPSVAPQSSIEEPTTEERERAVQEFERFLDRMFPARTTHTHIRDEEDQVNRCPSCTWELDEDGNCVNCGLAFRQAARSDNSDGSVSSSSSSASDDSDDDSHDDDSEEDERLGGFIVSDNEMTSDDMDDGSDDMDDSSDDDNDTSDSDMSIISGPGGPVTHAIESSDENMGFSSNDDTDDSSSSNSSSSSRSSSSSSNSSSDDSSDGSSGDGHNGLQHLINDSDNDSDSDNSSSHNSSSDTSNTDNTSQEQQTGNNMDTSSSSDSDQSDSDSSSSSDNSNSSDDDSDSNDNSNNAQQNANSIDISDSSDTSQSDSDGSSSSNNSNSSSKSASNSSDESQASKSSSVVDKEKKTASRVKEDDYDDEEKELPLRMTRKRRAALEAKNKTRKESTLDSNKRQRRSRA